MGHSHEVILGSTEKGPNSTLSPYFYLSISLSAALSNHTGYSKTARHRSPDLDLRQIRFRDNSHRFSPLSLRVSSWRVDSQRRRRKRTAGELLSSASTFPSFCCGDLDLGPGMSGSGNQVCGSLLCWRIRGRLLRAGWKTSRKDKAAKDV